jgi:hypothetical protein
MVTACLIATVLYWNGNAFDFNGDEDEEEGYDAMDGLSEEDAYLRGEGYKRKACGVFINSVLCRRV